MKNKYIIEYSKQVWRSDDMDCSGDFYPEVFYTMIVEAKDNEQAMKIAKQYLQAVEQYGNFSCDDEDIPVEDRIDYTATELNKYIKQLENNLTTLVKIKNEIDKENFIDECVNERLDDEE